MKIRIIHIILCWSISLVSSCTSPVDAYTEADSVARIDPDYAGIVLPPNIAPLNFRILEKAEKYHVVISSVNGTKIEIESLNGVIDIPIKKWKRLLTENAGQNLTFGIYGKQGKDWIRFKDIVNIIATDPIDSHLAYRILYPGYELWKDMGIYQRNLENFDQEPIIENKALGNDCVNCHSFAANSPKTMMFHVRGKNGGTIILSEGELKKRNIKAEDLPGGAVYPHWHPSGELIAFSSNKIKQFFHASGDKYIEVSDFESDLLVYDVEENKIMSDTAVATKEYMETFPAWSPDGKYLYYTRARAVGADSLKDIRYNLMRIAVDSRKQSWGEPEVIFDAASKNKSVSFPRISPDGKYLVFTMANYGNFTIWHNEADLYKLDLTTLEVEMLPVNSQWVESYHAWSSNSRWLVFSSKRRDTKCARPYFTYIDKAGTAHKPFIMPQKDPVFYDRFLKTYNIPEFIIGEVEIKQWDLINKARQSIE